MTTAEVSAQTGVTLRQLQHWAENGIVAPKLYATGPNDTRGDRDYSPADVRAVKILADLRSRGVSLQQSRWMMRCVKPYSRGIAVMDTGKRRFHIVPREQAVDWILNAAGPVVVIEIPEL